MYVCEWGAAIRDVPANEHTYSRHRYEHDQLAITRFAVPDHDIVERRLSAVDPNEHFPPIVASSDVGTGPPFYEFWRTIR